VTFIDTLRAARNSHVSVLHEFLTQYSPSERRLYLFVEGHEDGIFFSHFVARYAGAGVRVLVYRCEGKSKVFEMFDKIIERMPNVKSTLFFVDKDIDDIVGTPWPTDPRVFVTDVYSIENYLSERAVVQKFYAAAVRLAGVKFDETTIFDHYQHELVRFRRGLIPLMAWATIHRQAGVRPNLNNIHLSEICQLDDDCSVKMLAGRRIAHLNKVTGVQPRARFRQLVHVTRSMRQMLPERIVRGKFESWFVVEFWKHLVGELEKLAREAAGKVVIRPTLERSNLVAVLTPYADVPASLHRFLSAHLTTETPSAHTPRQSSVTAFFRAAMRWLGM
jgi:hypothetical protein